MSQAYDIVYLIYLYIICDIVYLIYLYIICDIVYLIYLYIICDIVYLIYLYIIYDIVYLRKYQATKLTNQKLTVFHHIQTCPKMS